MSDTSDRGCRNGLEPCPFCGGGETVIEERPLDRMPRMDGKPSPIISVTVRHWCPKTEGQPTGLNTSMHGRDRESAIAAWNRRAGQDGRRQAIEEAAKVAEAPYGDAVAAFGSDEPMAVGAKIAKAIRALVPPAKAHEGEKDEE